MEQLDSHQLRQGCFTVFLSALSVAPGLGRGLWAHISSRGQKGEGWGKGIGHMLLSQMRNMG